MEIGNRPREKAFAHIASVTAAVALLLSGCGPGDAPVDFGLGHHVDLRIASTQPEGGALALEYDFSRPIAVRFSQCVGGSGTTCDGGVLLYSSEDPGFAPLEADDLNRSLYVLAEGTPVRVELIEATPGASLFLNGSTLSRAGDAVLLGQAVEGLHRHGAWQIAVAGGDTPASSYALTFRLTTTSAQYSDSEAYTILLIPIAGSQ